MKISFMSTVYYILHTPTLHQNKLGENHSGCPNNGLPNSTTNHSRVIQPGSDALTKLMALVMEIL